ncbi:MAG TPA: peptide chain release factor 1 [Aggregatilineales bacterium]|nr:peptide chain release factor 1 [Aggregatilineales bacterium]
MLEKLAGIAARYEEIERLMGDPEIAADYEQVAEYAQERANLEPIVKGFYEYRQIEDEIGEAEALLDSEDAEMRELAQEELARLRARRDELDEELRLMLLPRDPRDAKNVILEIRAGTGGDEAALFAADLWRMYLRYAEKQGWKVEVLSSHEIGVGGLKEIVALLKGHGAYSRLKYESGVHRVQRVPATESQGRIHTSTATVAVLAEMDDVDVKINNSDLEIDSYRAGGAGGQHVQKNDTAIRITHRPSGLVVQCQDERSKTQNLLRAMSILRARLYEIELERQQAAQEADRRSQVGTGERSEKIRTYNYPQSRVTDHRINVSSYNLPAVMDGSLDEFIDELATRDQAERLQAADL